MNTNALKLFAQSARRQLLAQAAEKMMDLYYTDGDMTAYAALQGEDFSGGAGQA